MKKRLLTAFTILILLLLICTIIFIIKIYTERSNIEKISTAKENYQLKWGYTDSKLQSISLNTEYYTDPSYKYHHMDYTKYCIIHDEKGCSIYGKQNGILLEASPIELHSASTITGTYNEDSSDKEEVLDVISLTWLTNVALNN